MDNTTSTTTSTSYTYKSPSSYQSEKGWECPRCGRINAPWVRQCDCSRNNWTITCDDNEWWKKYTTCTSDTFKIHPDEIVYTTPHVGGSDYWDSNSNSYKNTTTYTTNTIHDGKLKYKEK